MTLFVWCYDVLRKLRNYSRYIFLLHSTRGRLGTIELRQKYILYNHKSIRYPKYFLHDKWCLNSI